MYVNCTASNPELDFMKHNFFHLQHNYDALMTSHVNYIASNLLLYDFWLAGLKISFQSVLKSLRITRRGYFPPPPSPTPLGEQG